MKTDKGQHSRYQGYPWLCRIITRNEYQARMIEPWVVFGMGICLTNAAPALGQFLIIGCASLFVTLCIETASIQAQAGDGGCQERRSADGGFDERGRWLG